MAPDDIETTFALATGYLRLKKVDQADALFKQLTLARPIPQTYVLIGRAYRDAAQYQRARVVLGQALAMDPHVRHAHFYLGTIPVMEEGVVRVEDAIVEFRRELELSPTDPLVNLRLGMALVEAHREKEALGPLEIAAKAPDAGMAGLSVSRAVSACARQASRCRRVASQGARSVREPAGSAQIGNLHYQLAMALRQTGNTAGADAEFPPRPRTPNTGPRADVMRSIASCRTWPMRPAPKRRRCCRWIREGRHAAGEREGRVGRRVASMLAGVYPNMGIMQAQADRFARAAELFEDAAAIDPAFPQVQYPLGVAYFNAQQDTKRRPP